MRHPAAFLFLALAASSVNARTYSTTELGRPKPFEISLGLSFGSVEAPLAGYDFLGDKVYLDDQNGAAIDARFHLPELFFLSVGAKAYADVSVISGGLGLAITAGDGRITLAAEEAYVNVSGLDEYWQFRLSASYDHTFGNGLRLGFGGHYITSSNDFFLNQEDVFAPVFTIGYRFQTGHALEINLSGKDYILGSPDSGGALSFGYEIIF